MAKLEKVLNALENCTAHPKCRDCGWKECEYEHETVEIPLTLAKDALALLKAQEPVAPYMDYDGQDVWRCGSCGATLFHLSHTQADENEQNCVKFCRYCGKAVKWDEI